MLGRDNRVPRVSKSVHFGLGVHIPGRGLHRRVDIPAIAPLFVRWMLASCAGRQVRRDRCRRDSSGSLPSAGTFHTSVTHRRGAIQRLYSHEFAWPHRGKSPTTMGSTPPRRVVSRQRDELHLRSDRHRVRNLGFYIICTREHGCVSTCILAILVARQRQIRIILILILTMYLMKSCYFWSL